MILQTVYDVLQGDPHVPTVYTTWADPMVTMPYVVIRTNRLYEGDYKYNVSIQFDIFDASNSSIRAFEIRDRILHLLAYEIFEDGRYRFYPVNDTLLPDEPNIVHLRLELRATDWKENKHD